MERTERISTDNDAMRRLIHPGHLGTRFVTKGVTDLGHDKLLPILHAVEAYDTFTEDNDPYGEHDCGFFTFEGEDLMWKIDYYDRASFGKQDHGSSDPADVEKTWRVLTILLSSEY